MNLSFWYVNEVRNVAEQRKSKIPSLEKKRFWSLKSILIESKWQYSTKETLSHAFHPLNTENRKKNKKPM